MLQRLKSLEVHHLRRQRHCIEHREANAIRLHDNTLINFCSNDYLGLAQHPFLIAAYTQAANEYGIGSTGSAFLSGYLKPHQQLEEEMAVYLNRDKALLFNSGYHANLGVLTTFADRNSLIVSDKLCHASLIDGITLSRAKHLRYRHNHIEQASLLLSQHPRRKKILVTESVFSMEGDIANTSTLADIAKQHQALFVVDDAHGVGLTPQQTDSLLIAPLGKAFATQGAIVASTHEHIDALLQFARTYRYSTALPPAVASATLAALHIMQTETWRQTALQAIIQFFIAEAAKRQLPLISNDLTPIKSILIHDNQRALQLQDALLAQGFYVSCIRPPTVPIGTARIRISLNCLHKESDIVRLLDLIGEHDG